MVKGDKSKQSTTAIASSRGAEEDRAQLHLRLQYTVAQILGDAHSEHEACIGVISAICERLGTAWGAVWIRQDEELRLLACWHASQCAAQEFDQISRACVFRIGEGMPGRAWEEQKVVQISDFTNNPDMPRRHAAARCGLDLGLAIPIIGKEFLGVIEFFSKQVPAPDAESLKMLSAAAVQIGQFLERQRTERALATSRGLFSGVFQGARDPILLANDSGKCIEANRAASKLLGIEKGVLLTKCVWDFVPIGAPNEAARTWSEICKGAGCESEFTYRRAEGGAIDFEYRITPRVTAGVHLVVLRDMTGRKQRERNARVLAAAGAILGEGLDFQASVNRVARVAIPEFADWCVLDLLEENGTIRRAAIAHADGTIEQEARALAGRLPVDPGRSFGAPNVIRTGRTELIDITPEIIRKITGEEIAPTIEKLNLGSAVISPLTRQGRTFGALSFWRIKARSAFSAEDCELADELARRAGWALDNARLYEAAKQELALREKAEADLKRLNAELEKRVAERTAALQESHTQLEAFCYSVSHDLRAPLRSMQGFSHALIEDHADKLNEEGQDFARRILGAAEHMDGLLADVLQYSRLSRQELKLEAVSVEEVLEDARMQLQLEVKKREADLQVADCACKVVANRSVLELMMVNLLDNALKFVSPGRAPKITVDCERRGEAMRIWVRDNGIGIAPEHRQKIFRIFERLHGVETYPGTGIGLALVQKAAARMNGAVGVDSTPGEGSAFWIELPSVNN